MARVVVQRGDVWWVALDPTVGTEMQKSRPAIVVSNASANQFGLRVVVVPVTSNVARMFPGNAAVTVDGRPGRAVGDQMRAVDKQRLLRRIGSLSADDLRAVEAALRLTLDL